MKYGRYVVERAVEELGITVEESFGSEWAVGLCPLHSDSSPSFAIMLDEGAWTCYAGCGSSGDLAFLVAQLTGEKPADARRRLQRGIPVDDESFRNALQEPQEGAQSPYTYVDDFEYIHGVVPRYMLSRGFTPETLKAWDIGWDPEAKAVVIPIRDKRKGPVVGLVRRLLEPRSDQGKYQNTPGLAKKGTLFGIDHVDTTVQEITVVEGPLDCLWLHQYNIPAVALLGASMAQGQADALLRNFWRVRLALDADDAGQKGIKRAKHLLSRMKVDVVTIPEGKKDVQELPEDQLRGLFDTRLFDTRLLDEPPS